MIEKIVITESARRNVHQGDSIILANKINEIIDYLNSQEPIHSGVNAAEYRNSTM